VISQKKKKPPMYNQKKSIKKYRYAFFIGCIFRLTQISHPTVTLKMKTLGLPCAVNILLNVQNVPL
jgi:hypothetical protein